MYLSYLQLNVSHPAVRQCLKDCQDMHRTIMRAFPAELELPSREAYGVLYRVMRDRLGVKVFVLSESHPDWQAIADQGFSCKGAKDISRLSTAFAPGRRFAFDALLCPTKKTARPEGASRRVFLASADERAQWLERQAWQNGFDIEWVREEGQNKERGVHDVSRGGIMYHAGVRFRGVLVIRDSSAFSKAFSKGLGPGKAYGFGLLMLFRA